MIKTGKSFPAFFMEGVYMAINAAAMWLNTAFADFDLSITLLVNRLEQLAGGFLTPFMEFVSFLCYDGIPLIILSLVLMLFSRTRRFGTAMLAGLAIGAIFTNCCLKVLIARPRPYADETSVFYRLWTTVGCNTESDKCFPSGHTTAAFAAMTSLFLTTKNKKISWTCFIFAILVGISRIYLVVHYPTDVIAGVIVGIIAGMLGYLVMLRIPRRFYESGKPLSLLKRNGGNVKKDDGSKDTGSVKRSKGGAHCR